MKRKKWPWESAPKERTQNSRRQNDPFYNSQAWKSYRRRFLQASPENQYCSRCARVGVYVPGTIVNHIEPRHMGGEDFPPFSGLEAVCYSCHQSISARQVTRRRADPDDKIGVG